MPDIATERMQAVVDQFSDAAWADAVRAVQVAASMTDDVELSDGAAEDVICAVVRSLLTELSPSPVSPSGESRTPCADGPCTLSPGCAGPSLQETQR